MSLCDSDLVFAGSVPELYERYLVPLIFEPYAADMVERLSELEPSALLEVAAGTGVVTRALSAGLAEPVSIVATDLNQPMVDQAAAIGTARPVRWQQADVIDLPFEDGTFDAVVCQFGVMFFPDRAEAFREVFRVLRPGGTFVFNVWDRIENNEFADVVTEAMRKAFPDDPPSFLRRTPHGYFAPEVIQPDVAAGGFDTPVTLETLERRSRAETCEAPAVAYCQGTPLRNEIEARDPSRLAEATSVAADAIAARFGRHDVDGKICAQVIAARKP